MKELTSTMNQEEMVSNLSSDICKVAFIKRNGEERIMNCTLQSDYLPELKGSTHKRNKETISVWDVDKNAWRSFRLNSVK